MSEPEMKCAMGFDAEGKLCAAAWIDEHTSAREARNFVRRGSKRVRTVSYQEAREIMRENKWGTQ